MNSQFDEKNYKKKFSDEFDKKEAMFEEVIQKELVISLLGDVNVGKSSTINALTGKKLSDVSSYAGHTKEVSLHRYSENVVIADTPGLQDINEETSKKAEDFISNDTDIILFFFNASVGPTQNMIKTFNSLKKLNKPIITVLNKIDIWYEGKVLVEEEDYETIVNQIEKETRQEVIPISSKKNFHIDVLNNEILNVLEDEGKDILFLKVSKYKENKVKAWINGASITSFGIGVIPVPGADIIPLTSLQVSLAMRIAYIYDCKASKKDVMSLIGATVTGSLGKQLFKYGIQALKGLGWFGGPFGTGATATLGGSIAASITYGFGWACNAYYKNGMNLDLSEVGEVYECNYREYFHKKVPTTVR
ncbi:GTPase [Guptibacillus hwajinpoensis]|uniref:GTPase n=1 Tax=Guptibacillus hwajinpoensis TaxID=208199 RepID=UPI0024B36E35|nr:GTPase [Pseudalkalibacillus hwajinpoensis]